MVFGEDGRHHSPASMPHTSKSPPNPGWVEHDALEILANIRRCLSQCDMVDAIGFGASGRKPAGLGRRQRPAAVQPSFGKISAYRAEIQRLKREGVEPLVMAKTGLPLDTYFSASKMAG
ncbi:hypothetical protein M8494_10135 [Serratia ureilytica]